MADVGLINNSPKRRDGRPRAEVDGAEVVRLREAGTSWRDIAGLLCVGTATAMRAYKAAYGVPKPSQNSHQDVAVEKTPGFTPTTTMPPNEMFCPGFNSRLRNAASLPIASADRTEMRRASDCLARAEVRLIDSDGSVIVGVWSDLDSALIRGALEVVGWARFPICYLDGSSVPDKLKTRRVEGEPVPLNVLAEMQRQQSKPWVVRDRMLKEIDWRPNGIPWREWEAAETRRIFRTQANTANRPQFRRSRL
jgi:hypothetical protein